MLPPAIWAETPPARASNNANANKHARFMRTPLRCHGEDRTVSAIGHFRSRRTGRQAVILGKSVGKLGKSKLMARRRVRDPIPYPCDVHSFTVWRRLTQVLFKIRPSFCR